MIGIGIAGITGILQAGARLANVISTALGNGEIKVAGASLDAVVEAVTDLYEQGKNLVENTKTVLSSEDETLVRNKLSELGAAIASLESTVSAKLDAAAKEE
jgi:hypothetical protein